MVETAWLRHRFAFQAPHFPKFFQMVTPGGEASFVGSLISESFEEGLRDKVGWFTTMVGKKVYVLVALGGVPQFLHRPFLHSFSLQLYRPVRPR